MTAGTRSPSNPVFIALLGLAVLAIAGLTAAGAAAQSAAELRSQIKRYGCHLPQYATSVEGCRKLYKRLRAARSGGGPAYANRGSSRYSNRGGQRRSSSRSGGGSIFSFLFGSPQQRPPSGNSPPYDSRFRSGGYDNASAGRGTYRTLCVRLCDGYYFPISYSTVRSRFSRDAEQCRSSCSAPARLFVYPNPGGSVDHMVDLQGRPYSGIDNAFRYREEYMQDCRCKPAPWSDEAQQMYTARASGQPAEADAGAKKAETADTGVKNTADVETERQNWPARTAVSQRNRRETWRDRAPASRSDDARFGGRWWAGAW